ALICLAGGFAWTGTIDASDPALLARQFTINVETAYGATRAFLPALRVAKGSVVYIASAAVMPGGDISGTAAYAIAKAGVLALMRSVSQGEAVHGVRANAVAPQAIRTAANISSMGEGQRYVERGAVAQAIVWLAGGAGEFVTGQTIVLA
nr:SDR family oxidoreductase [Gemmatimonadaceae bacterium]